MRSWRVDNTSPSTRVDVATGNEDTNLYRGYYGKRFDNGGVLQLAGQQYGVTSSRFAGSGDALSAGAVGMARRLGTTVRTRPTLPGTSSVRLVKTPNISLDQLTPTYLALRLAE